MKTIPTIMKYMTVLPHSISSDQTIEVAQGIMKEHQIRHLPVLKAGQISAGYFDADDRGRVLFGLRTLENDFELFRS